MLHDWLNRLHVSQWWNGPISLEKAVQEYGGDIDSPQIAPYLVYLDGMPIGFAQVYRVMDADPSWWKGETDAGARGIDQFLANASQLSQGIGSEMIMQFTDMIFQDPEVTKIQTDPAPDNLRAIRSYEKAGFKREKLIDTPDGRVLLMLKGRGT
jgi:RimJ/RimL family protein N-acetyltransferase